MLLDSLALRLPSSVSVWQPGTARASPPVCSTARSTSTKAERAAKRKLSRRIGQYVRQLAQGECYCIDDTDEAVSHCDGWLGCARSLRLIDQMEAENLPLTTDAKVAVMRACTSRLDVVERMFSSLVEAKATSEGSYAALMQARVQQGELGAAVEALERLLVEPRRDQIL